MSALVQHREEFVFIYDVTDNNPNGNPMDENKPRIDEETGYNLVTDVRIKRTVRDYLFEYEGHNGTADRDIFVRMTEAKGGGLKDGKARAKDFDEDADTILNKCIDIRLFGGVIPLKNDSIRFTGAVQLRMARSLHKVAPLYIKGTGAFASKEGALQNTFRTEYVLPYSLIRIYGVVNEHAARYTRLTEDDVELFYTALWEGTKSLHSRSKLGHAPRALVRVRYKTPNFFIGELDKRIVFKSDLPDENIRDIQDGKLDLSALKAVLDREQQHIEQATLKTDDRVRIDGW
ncbi:MAG: type I-B CRISPR-associated protein Cas7/Csh2 [Bacteroidota bacterium]|nr:type I-B CRISPR-associated protein Cas7/Csh2 [Candidatus Kapabacteria bacterium]MDW8221244.1 type I-B CRISPR-associated protein Cas7/Csh2 [Bacteroidota bacterium]